MRARRWSTTAAALAAALACNGGLEPTPVCGKGFVGVCGTVTFRGTIPDSTAGVYVVAYAHFPQQLSDLLTFTPLIPQPLPLPGPGDSTTFYAVPLPSGRYEWVLAAWRKQGTFTGSNADSLFREAGFYKHGADTTAHGSGIVTVSGTGTDSINIVVDFNNMHPISYYFP